MRKRSHLSSIWIIILFHHQSQTKDVKFEIKGVNVETRKIDIFEQKRANECRFDLVWFCGGKKRINHSFETERDDTSKANRQFRLSLNHFCAWFITFRKDAVRLINGPKSGCLIEWIVSICVKVTSKWWKKNLKSGRMINAKPDRTSIFGYPHVLRWKIYDF